MFQSAAPAHYQKSRLGNLFVYSPPGSQQVPEPLSLFEAADKQHVDSPVVEPLDFRPRLAEAFEIDAVRDHPIVGWEPVRHEVSSAG